jgi:hypothetical protein
LSSVGLFQPSYLSLTLTFPVLRSHRFETVPRFRRFAFRFESKSSPSTVSAIVARLRSSDLNLALDFQRWKVSHSGIVHHFCQFVCRFDFGRSTLSRFRVRI